MIEIPSFGRIEEDELVKLLTPILENARVYERLWMIPMEIDKPTVYDENMLATEVHIKFSCKLREVRGMMEYDSIKHCIRLVSALCRPRNEK